MNHLDRLNIFLNKLFLILGGVAVLGLMILATSNVVLRIFHMPYMGAYEIVSFLGAVVIAFALGYTQKKKDHIVVDILTEKFPGPLNRFLDRINYFVTLIFFSIVTWQIFVWGMKIWESHEVSETMKIIYYPFVFCVSLGFGTLSLTLLIDLLKTFKKKEEN
ncbi:MAG: TRAP transporter small permease [Syntrophobacterales bacterium]|jgi:TRAP-type C4-dicarboxylate transport system permease small subunit|nr:TRAP transporter small permease [Syntrophobacterales bacterium]